MEERITVERLTPESVSVVRQKVTEADGGVWLNVGLPHRKAYRNNEFGRSELAAEVAEPYRSSILAVWDSKAAED